MTISYTRFFVLLFLCSAIIPLHAQEISPERAQFLRQRLQRLTNEYLPAQDGNTVPGLHMLVELNAPLVIDQCATQANLNINARDSKHGHTALIKAAGSGKVDAVRVLLKHGAQVGILDNYGYRAYDYVRLLNTTETTSASHEIQTLLEKYGAHLFSPIGLSHDYKTFFIPMNWQHLPREKKEHFLNFVREFNEEQITLQRSLPVRKWAIIYGVLQDSNLPLSTLCRAPIREGEPIRLSFPSEFLKKITPKNAHTFKNLTLEEQRTYNNQLTLYRDCPTNSTRLPVLVGLWKKAGLLDFK